MVKCLRFREKREFASLIFAFARGSLFYCVLLNAIVKTLAFKKRYGNSGVNTVNMYKFPDFFKVLGRPREGTGWFSLTWL